MSGSGRFTPTPLYLTGGNLATYGGNTDFGKVLTSPDLWAGTHACALKTTGTYAGYLFCWGTQGNYEFMNDASNRFQATLVPNDPWGQQGWKDFAFIYRGMVAINAQ